MMRVDALISICPDHPKEGNKDGNLTGHYMLGHSTSCMNLLVISTHMGVRKYIAWSREREREREREGKSTMWAKSEQMRRS